MRFINFFTSLPLLALMAASCTQQEEFVPPADDELRDVKVSLNLGVKGGLQMLGRSGDSAPLAAPPFSGSSEGVLPRPLTDFNAGQMVNDMRIYVFRSESADGDYKYFNPTGTLPYYEVKAFANMTPYTATPLEEHMYSFNPKLTAGYYKFLAVGRDDISVSEYSEGIDAFSWVYKCLDEPKFTHNSTSIQEASLFRLKNATSIPDDAPFWCTEYFTGSLTSTSGDSENSYIRVTKDAEGFSRSITCHRAVAGIYLNLTGIKYSLSDNSGTANNGKQFVVRKIDLVASCAAKNELLLTRTLPANAEFVQNAVIVRLDLTTRVSDTGDVGTGIIHDPRGEKWKGFNYMMPLSESSIQANKGANLWNEDLTFYLRYSGPEVGNSTNQCSKYQKVSLSSKINSDGSVEKLTPSYLFPIISNCIYAIGTPTQPYDLSDPEAVVNIQVCPYFEKLHKFEVIE